MNVNRIDTVALFMIVKVMLSLIILVSRSSIALREHLPRRTAIRLNGISHSFPGRTILYQQQSSAVEAEGRKTSSVIEQKKYIGEKIDLSPPKGTRDFYPEDQRLKGWLFSSWRTTAASFGFEEYDSSVVENEALFIRKAGDEVTQQLYNFEDKGGRRLSLRPEMTPSLARMVLAKGNALALPIRWFSIPQCWRYERMTRGRRREHYQWNMDIWGVEDVTAEAELLSAIVTNMKSLGLTSADVGIKINSRKVLNDMMKKLDIPEDKWAATYVLIDKLEKVSLTDLSKDLEQIGLKSSIVEELMSCVRASSIDSLRSLLGTETEGLRDIEKIFQLADHYGYKDWLQFDASVVRGLSYYTGVVFEGFDRSGQLRAICGGGRYDNLLNSLGGDAIPAVGFGFGDAVIVELLKMKGLLPDVSKNSIDALVFSYNSDLQGVAVATATSLRSAGIKTDLVLDNRKSKWVFQRADKIGAKVVVMVAPDEWKDGKIIVKNLSNDISTENKQFTCDFDRIAESVMSIIKQ